MLTKYQDRQRGERFTALRSLRAHQRGECSQYELRRMASGSYIGGLSGDLARLWGHLPIVAQWSAGYRICGAVEIGGMDYVSA